MSDDRLPKPGDIVRRKTAIGAGPKWSADAIGTVLERAGTISNGPSRPGTVYVQVDGTMPCVWECSEIERLNEDMPPWVDPGDDNTDPFCKGCDKDAEDHGAYGWVCCHARECPAHGVIAPVPWDILKHR